MPQSKKRLEGAQGPVCHVTNHECALVDDHVVDANGDRYYYSTRTNVFRMTYSNGASGIVVAASEAIARETLLKYRTAEEEVVFEQLADVVTIIPTARHMPVGASQAGWPLVEFLETGGHRLPGQGAGEQQKD